jgi:hypothetical protein
MLSFASQGIDRFLADGSIARLGVDYKDVTPSLANAEIIVSSQLEYLQVLFKKLF